MSPRWLIYLLLLWLINIPVNNWLEGDSFFNAEQTAALTNTQNYTYTTAVDSNGVDVNYFDKARDTWTQIIDASSYNYTFFYDIDPVTGENVPNQFMFVRYFLIAISVVIIIFVIITLVTAVKP
jgi:hypothetical protein